MTELTEKNLAEKLQAEASEGYTTGDGKWRGIARMAAELLGVDLAPEPNPLPTEPGSVITATEVRGVTGKWRMFCDPDGDWFAAEAIGGWRSHFPKHITVWTEAVVVPAGKQIDPADVQEGDRVRVVLNNGDEATITVTRVAPDFLTSERYVFYTCEIRAIHLLDREGEA